MGKCPSTTPRGSLFTGRCDVKPLYARRWLLLRVRMENKAGRWLVRLGQRLEWDARGRVAAAVNEWKGKSDDSPFTVPPLECRECGRSDRHVYCWRWLETLRLLLGGDPVAHK